MATASVLTCVGCDSKLPSVALRMTNILTVIGIKRRICMGVTNQPITLYLNVPVTLRLHEGGRLLYVECKNGKGNLSPTTVITAKLISIDPLREYSVQPLCLYRYLYKQPLPNLELAYFSNMCNFRESDVNTSLYLMSAPTCRRFRWP